MTAPEKGNGPVRGGRQGAAGKNFTPNSALVVTRMSSVERMRGYERDKAAWDSENPCATWREREQAMREIARKWGI